MQKKNIPSSVLFLPDTFPVKEFKGKMIAGMGTPDILGTEGSFTLFSTANYPLDPKWRGRFVPIPNETSINTSLTGPKYSFLNETKTTTVPLKIQKKAGAVTITVQNQRMELKEHEFSPWVKLEFSIDFFTKISGITQFYVKQLSPEIQIYASPINFDPANPVYQIASPKGYAKELAKKYGTFSTLGLPHDTWALEEGIISDDDFIKNADNILNERKKIILGELKNTDSGVFFGYFGVTDTMQHMYWRFLDDDQSKYQNTIMDYYRKLDAIIGEAMKSLGTKDDLIILSDHGFSHYDYEVNINTWLKKEGYLYLKDGKDTGGQLLEDVDWSRTKAYSLGYNGIYLNLQGREANGIVTAKEAIPLEKDLIGKLLQFVNPVSGGPIFKRILTRKDLAITEENTLSPDLFLGYYKGARSSWDTAVGAVPQDTVIKRQSKWSGDHLFDASEVPGVLFTNKHVRLNNPRIIDIIPTVLKQYHITTPALDGKPLW